jgi:hypothetical protein
MTIHKMFLKYSIFVFVLFLPFFVFSKEIEYSPLTDIGDFSKSLINKAESGLPTNLTDLINFAFYVMLAVAVVLAIFGVIRGGYVYLTSADSGSNKSRAKRILQASVGGLLLALGGWLILDTINPQILKFDPKYQELQKPEVVKIEITQEQRGSMTYEEMEALLEELRDPSKENAAFSKINWTPEKEALVRQTLLEMGVLVNNQNNPLNRVTDVAGLQDTTINGIRRLLLDAGVSAGETVWLTGGSETYVHSSSGDKNHHTGYKADFRGNLGGGEKNPGDIKLDTFLNQQLGNNSAKTTTLSSGQTITILKESDHWDVKFH